jgi:hypothetical protein
MCSGGLRAAIAANTSHRIASSVRWGLPFAARPWSSASEEQTMGIFGAILDKLRGRAQQAPAGQQAGAQAGVSPAGGPTQARSEAGREAAVQAGVQPAAGASPSAALQDVDVEAVLAQMASQKNGGGGNYRQSIVDLLKLLDLDSSLGARKELAEELNVHAGAHGSAEQNVALHKAVMRKLAENGGKVPASLRD